MDKKRTSLLMLIALLIIFISGCTSIPGANEAAIASGFFHNEQDDLIIAMTPPGTRSKTDRWKSGFYHIAFKAQIPVLLGYADYENKKAGTGPSFIPSGDVKKDMDIIREFYKDIRGGNPELESDIILREEMQ